jgi:hypothetical protein
MKNNTKLLNYYFYFNAIAFGFLIIPKTAYASGMEGFGYLIAALFILIAAICGFILKCLFDVPAKERGVLKELSFFIMIAEFFSMIVALIVGRSIEISIEPVFQINMLYFSFPIYFILATFFNLFLYQKKNEKYLKTLSNVANIANALMSSIFTPIISSGLGILAASQ